MKNIESRLQQLEQAILPGPPVVEFELHVRMAGDDGEIIRITNFLNGSDPSPTDRTWIRNEGETYAAFRQRAKADYMKDLRPGLNTALFSEHITMGDNIVTA